MARVLKPGNRVRTVGGLVAVNAVSDDSVQPVFDLEIAHGQSFFVGLGGILVHDHGLVQPTSDPFDPRPALAALVTGPH
jgi:hypothetical protein